MGAAFLLLLSPKPESGGGSSSDCGVTSSECRSRSRAVVQPIGDCRLPIVDCWSRAVVHLPNRSYQLPGVGAGRWFIFRIRGYRLAGSECRVTSSVLRESGSEVPVVGFRPVPSGGLPGRAAQEAF